MLLLLLLLLLLLSWLKTYGFCARKLIENLKLFYKSNKPHLLWVYRRDNSLGMLGEHEKSL